MAGNNVICAICSKKFNSYRALSCHISKSHKDISKEWYYQNFLQKDKNEHLCPVCGRKKRFYNFNQGYRKYCSTKCSGNDETVKLKAKKTILEKYGVDHHMKLKKTINLLKKTYSKKTGYEWPAQNPDVKKKREQTNKRKYGDENYNNIEKSKATKLKKYGNENYNNVEKNKKTCLEKYGVDNVFKTKKVRNDRKLASSIKKYNDLFKNEKFKKRITPLFDSYNYISVKTKYKFKCNLCDTIFEDDLDNGKVPRCPKCYPIKSGVSKMETELFEFLKVKLKINNIIRNTKNIIPPYELDIFCPNQSIAIELNGNYWHSELTGKDKNYHLNKTNECEKNNIHLIHIFEDEWYNKQDIIKKRLSVILNKNNDEKFYAKNCFVSVINFKTKSEFITETHIQGDCVSTINLGLYSENSNKLLSVMTFGTERFSNNKNYEILRYSTKARVVGGFNKILSYFIKNYNPQKIVSYADRRWSYINENVYKKNNFKLLSVTSPNYWYMKNYLQRYHRFNFRKGVLNKRLENFDPNLTEWQNMQLNGYDRIWDCGSLKYEMIIK